MATVYLDIPRKSLGQLQVLKSTDSGGTWATVTGTLDSTKNQLAVDAADTDIVVLASTANAKQTKPSTNKPVLNGEAGVGSVFAIKDARTIRGSLIAESTIGKVLTSNNAAISYMTYRNLTPLVEGNTGIMTYVSKYAPHHAPLSLAAPNNNSPAVKALPYQISDNGQVSIGIQANELAWDTGTDTIANGSVSNNYSVNVRYRITGEGSSILVTPVANLTGVTFYTDYIRRADGNYYTGGGDLRFIATRDNWGDDSTMKITASGSDTFVDLNGNTNLSVAHELSLPIGWSHNRSRVSTQKDGVDL